MDETHARVNQQMTTTMHFPIVVLSLLMLPLGAISLKPGDRFPDLAFPSVRGGEDLTVSSLHEKKLLLHLFASW